MNNKILITGATGLIAKEALEYLKNKGFDIFAIVHNKPIDKLYVHSLKADLFDFNAIKSLLASICPSYLLHFAWDTTQGYLESDSNLKFYDASMNLLKSFIENSGSKAVFAGTCFEYDFKNDPLKESDNLNPKTLYAKTKVLLHDNASKLCSASNVDFIWGRIFYVFGREEHENRLTAKVITKLLNNEILYFKSSNLVRDYMYTKDIANVFVELISSNLSGDFNICSGQGLVIEDYVKKIATKLGKTELLKFEQVENLTEPKIIVGNNSKLLEKIGSFQKYDLDTALDEILQDYL